MSVKSFVPAVLRSHTAVTLVLRAGIVGVNFAVMLWLAWQLGLADFGALIFVWGVALVASAVISLGGPLILLRDLSNGSGLHLYQIAGVVVIGPLLLSILCWGALELVWPDGNWAVVLQVSLFINCLSCSASAMRAVGSVQASMVLRDAAPFCALGLAAALAPEGTTADIMQAAALLMMCLCTCCVIWCAKMRDGLPRPAGKPCLSLSLWGTSILGMVISQIDLIIGGALMGAEALGVYAFLRRITNLVALPVTVATWVSAKPIAAAYGANDSLALARASIQASRIAWYPALGLSGLCVCGLIGASLTPFVQVTQQGAFTFCALLCGAMVQAYLAAGFTVATLGAHAHTTAIARALTVLTYVVLAALCAGFMTPVSNAIIYVIAMSLSSGLVWSVLWRDLGVDTSARAFWLTKGAQWRTS